MNKVSFNILRIGLAITFTWIGILILQQPEVWGSYLQPWAVKLLPMPIKEMMIGTGIFDIIIAVLFLIDPVVWIAALLATLHLVIVLITSGINEGTVRDIGILTATMALLVDSWPRKWKSGISLMVK